MRIRFLLSVVLALIGTLFGFASASAQTTPSCAANPCKGIAIFQVDAWEWGTLSPELQQEILRVDEMESRFTYSLSPSAVSRDLHTRILAEWQRGTAKGATKQVTGTLEVPTRGSLPFTATPGKDRLATPHMSRLNPEMTFHTRDVDVGKLLKEPDPQFVAVAQTPAGCRMVYPGPKRGGRITTRQKGPDGENEILVIVNRKIAERANDMRLHVHFIFDCSRQNAASS